MKLLKFKVTIFMIIKTLLCFIYFPGEYDTAVYETKENINLYYSLFILLWFRSPLLFKNCKSNVNLTAGHKLAGIRLT